MGVVRFQFLKSLILWGSALMFMCYNMRHNSNERVEEKKICRKASLLLAAEEVRKALVSRTTQVFGAFSAHGSEAYARFRIDCCGTKVGGCCRG